MENFHKLINKIIYLKTKYLLANPNIIFYLQFKVPYMKEFLKIFLICLNNLKLH